ncbi:PAS/PAC sensor signal transduction histidine kinase [Psychromonas ingrahamii 37]|uniref:histidine kinase n=1 Tax=Psychromonas ingrahamii (strain DSM 17664 / CCUG 51855 / 37) TaxID=357804 RepID=A1ST64_PSYIN|nr:ATP-binding protein [Psychromonas ingrahamii]ABM02679.1 PAS/PAC sensor signal transduction histidine kinase [Psychromonas ingrahamii 37]
MLKSSLFKPSLLRRLFVGYVVLILSLTIIVSVLISRQTTENTLQEIHHSLLIRAQFLAELSKSVFPTPPQASLAALNQKIVALGKKTQSRLTLITENGRVLADSQKAPQSMDNHANRPEIIAARQQHIVPTTRFSDTLQKNMIYLALPIIIEQKVQGFVRVSLPITIIDNKLSQLRFALALSAFISALVALILGYYFVERFSAPLRKITAVAEAISKGDYSKRIITHQKDEIGLLANSFNLMAQSAEKRLDQIETERNRLAIIFAGMVEGVIYINEHLQIIHMNQVAAQMFNLSNTSSINQPLAEQIPVPEITAAVQAAIANQGVVKTKIQNNDHAKNAEVIDIYVAALSNDLGESVGVVVVLNDISELAYLERVRRDFVANASHELKTPITVILGLAETILDYKDMPENMRTRFMGDIQTQTLRLSSLVTDLMSISRLETTQNGVMTETVDLTASVKNALSNVDNICREKKITLSNRLPKGEMLINGDKEEINQLIDNLIGNAIKYTPSLGHVSVTLKALDEQAQIIVKDTGIGISLSHQQRIFERFYRVDKARSRDLGGTGLGLSIVKNIVEKHKGTISVSSIENHGSTFTLLLPLS